MKFKGGGGQCADIHTHYFVYLLCMLKGKFSSGREGALASTLNHDFNWKQLSEMILCIFCDVFKVYLSNIDSETEIYIF